MTFRRLLCCQAVQVLTALLGIICALAGIWSWIMADSALTPEVKAWLCTACVSVLVHLAGERLEA